MIKAECHSDDHVYATKFDATPFFEAATDDALLALAQCNWGGDYPADEVANSLADTNSEIAAMFDYLAKIDDTRAACGFECHVDEDDAIAWITANRPHLLEKIENDDA